jgi:type VI secretion system protein ImpK
MELVECFIDIFVYVTHLAKKQVQPAPPGSEAKATDKPPAAGGSKTWSGFFKSANVTGPAVDFQTVKGQLEQLLSKSEALSREHDFSREDYENAKFAVCAWVDERILCSAWDGRLDWLNESWQRRFFHTANAGEEFMHRLQELPADKGTVRKVYMLCLALGFQGPYDDAGEGGELDRLSKQIYKQVLGDKYPEALGASQLLFPQAYPQGQPAAERPRRSALGMRTGLVAALWASGPLLFLVLYWLYGAMLDSTIAGFFRASQ